MSLVFDALRDAEQQAKRRRATLAAGKDGRGGNGIPQTESPISEHSGKEGETDLHQLLGQLGSLADRLEASRGSLEELIAQARQAQESAQVELEKIQHKIQETGLGASVAAAKMRAEVLQELESLARRAVEQADKQIEERAAAVVERQAKAAESSLAAAAAESISHALEPVIQEMANRFQTDLRAVVGGFETELQQRADGLVKSASELMREQAESLFRRLGGDLVTTGGQLGRDAARQLADAKSGLERVKAEAEAAIEQSRFEARKMVEELRQASARDLRTEFDKQRDAMARQLQQEAGELGRAALDRLMGALGGASQVAREAVYKQVGQAAAVLKEWQDQAREKLVADVQKSLEAFGKQLAELSAGVLEQDRRRLRLWVDDLQARMQQADQALKGGSQNLKRGQGN